MRCHRKLLRSIDSLEKPFEDERLVGVIEDALKRGSDAAGGNALTVEIVSRIASLSQRERQVMEGLASGLSNKQIARNYDISPRTIEIYRANVMTKMQADSISELVQFAIRAGASCF